LWNRRLTQLFGVGEWISYQDLRKREELQQLVRDAQAEPAQYLLISAARRTGRLIAGSAIASPNWKP